MASIRKSVDVAVDRGTAWAALRRVGDPHELFAPVLTSGRLEGDTRTVTFANGMTVRERILDVDEASCRVAYTVLDGPGMSYHHASMEIVDAGNGRCRFVWTTDFLPPEIGGTLTPLIDQGTAARKANLERSRAR